MEWNTPGVNFRVLATPQLAAEECARHILILLEDAMAAGAKATLAISGGSSPLPMFQYLARADVPWDRVHVFWVDERCVPPTDAQSNFKLAYDSWLGPARFPAANIHRVVTELGPQAAAQAYAADIRAFFGLREGQLPQFEVIHLGMGADAHTASLFPGDPLIADRENIAAAVWVPKMNQWRVTLLPGVLASARHSLMLVAGADKIPALSAVRGAALDPLRYPAQIGRDALWFVDSAATDRLQQP